MLKNDCCDYEICGKCETIPSGDGLCICDHPEGVIDNNTGFVVTTYNKDEIEDKIEREKKSKKKDLGDVL